MSNRSEFEAHDGQTRNLTPVDLDALQLFYEGLCRIEDTLLCSAPAAAGIALSRSLYDLLQSKFGQDARFDKVMANIWVQEVSTIKRGGDVR